MEIIKKIDFEMAHIVRNAWSQRCSKSIHGHTYTAELFFSRTKYHNPPKPNMDNGQMVVDFGLISKFIKPYIDSFDHATLLWEKDEDDIKLFFRQHFDRVIICPESSSCETMSVLFLEAINLILDQLREEHIAEMTNYFDNVICHKVIIHETKSGRAEADLNSCWRMNNRMKNAAIGTWFSLGIKNEWTNEFKEIWKKACQEKY